MYLVHAIEQNFKAYTECHFQTNNSTGM